MGFTFCGIKLTPTLVSTLFIEFCLLSAFLNKLAFARIQYLLGYNVSLEIELNV